MKNKFTGIVAMGMLLIASVACQQAEQEAQQQLGKRGEEDVAAAKRESDKAAKEIKVTPEQAPQKTTEGGMPVSPVQVEITEEIEQAVKEPSTAKGLTTKEGVPVSPAQIEITEEVDPAKVEP
jgi:hypothetical protein